MSCSNVSVTYYDINGLHSRINMVRCNKLKDHEFIVNIKSDIICLAETNCKSQTSHDIQLNGHITFSVYRLNLKRKGSGGLAILVKKHIRPSIKFEKIIVVISISLNYVRTF